MKFVNARKKTEKKLLLSNKSLDPVSIDTQKSNSRFLFPRFQLLDRVNASYSHFFGKNLFCV